ncbi:hypothetical protein EL06_27490 [Salmonella enterica subsp. diarizonae]|uniref:Uncharacterized protein n=1 Tax=Salmonella diarizonae TaxID=59204 RepID=A0A6C8Y7T3_SALDZ|nr:hypothetical protein [Salmonella enterica subsp. diarizonae]
MPFCTLPERGNGVYVYQGDRILPEAVVIHNRFNTPFTSNLIAEGYYFSPGCTLSHFLRLYLLKVLTTAEKINPDCFPVRVALSFFNNLFIFKLATQVTFNAVAQSCNMVDIFR